MNLNIRQFIAILIAALIYLTAMNSEKVLRNLVREMLEESIEPSLTGNVSGKPSIVLGPNAKKFLAAKMTPEEINLVFERMNNVSLEQFQRYDAYFDQYGNEYGIPGGGSLLKAMAIEETTLGKNLRNQSGSTAAGVIQITAPTLKTLNQNLPEGQHYDYKTLTSDPAKSIQIAAHYISEILMKGQGLGSLEQILARYKTGPDMANYVKRVKAFQKFVKASDPKKYPH